MVSQERKKFYEQESPKIIEAYVKEQDQKKLEFKHPEPETVDVYEEQETIIDDDYSNQNYEIDELETENEGDQLPNDQYDQNVIDEIQDSEDNVTTIMEFEIEQTRPTKNENDITFVLNKTQSDQVTYSIMNIDHPEKKLENPKIEDEEMNDQTYEEQEQANEDETSRGKSIKLTDFEYESVFQAVKETVATQCGSKPQEEIKFRIVSREGSITQVEVELEDESLLVLEIELEKEVKKKVCFRILLIDLMNL